MRQPLTRRLRVYGHSPGATSRPPGFHAPAPPSLVLGRDQLGDIDRLPLGITPARAGNRGFTRALLQNLWNYPRLCGEQVMWRAASSIRWELPPLVRGTVMRVSHLYHASGITPARAGNRAAQQNRQNSYRNYPRSCGEQPREDADRIRGAELPPLVRGTAHPNHMSSLIFRITPARAGNRHFGALLPCRGGELPPLVRGTGQKMPTSSLHKGITPARAGNSGIHPHHKNQARNYPRSCGEQA